MEPSEMLATALWLTKKSDADLDQLEILVKEEKGKRYCERIIRRNEWIQELLFECYSSGGKIIKVGDTTVVAIADGYGSVSIGKATPVKGDKFDIEVGIAVAYAKAKGKPVPSFI